ncbi:hypothetical protein NTB99_004578 [Salmonella enterica]|nr:hypothetical protein [Salmonella enterica]
MAQGTESLGCHFALSRNRPPECDTRYSTLRHYSLNIKTFGHLCRSLTTEHPAVTLSSPQLLLPVTSAPETENITLTLNRASLSDLP